MNFWNLSHLLSNSLSGPAKNSWVRFEDLVNMRVELDLIIFHGFFADESEQEKCHFEKI